MDFLTRLPKEESCRSSVEHHLVTCHNMERSEAVRLARLARVELEPEPDTITIDAEVIAMIKSALETAETTGNASAEIAEAARTTLHQEAKILRRLKAYVEGKIG